MSKEVWLKIEYPFGTEQFEDEINKISDLSYKKIKTNGLNGVDIILYILSIGGGVAITQLGVTIANFIKRNEGKRIKINDIEIAGYEKEEALEIMKEAMKIRSNDNEIND